MRNPFICCHKNDFRTCVQCNRGEEIVNNQNSARVCGCDPGADHICAECKADGVVAFQIMTVKLPVVHPKYMGRMDSLDRELIEDGRKVLKLVEEEQAMASRENAGMDKKLAKDSTQYERPHASGSGNGPQQGLRPAPPDRTVTTRLTTKDTSTLKSSRSSATTCTGIASSAMGSDARATTGRKGSLFTATSRA